MQISNGTSQGSTASGAGPKLNSIGLKYGTDKSSMHHNFLDFYERRLRHLQNAKFTMLEIGVHKGGSLRTWAEYFPEATIVGLDIVPDCKQHEHKNAHVRIGDQSNPNFLFEVISEFGRPLVVIDDGSHRWDHQICSLQTLFPIVPPSGIYIVEDIDTSFGGYGDNTHGYSTISAFDYVGALNRFVVGDWATKAVERPYDLFVEAQYQNVETIEFFRRTCVISKK